MLFRKLSGQKTTNVTRFLHRLDSKTAPSQSILQKFLYEFCTMCDSCNLGHTLGY